jgi:hypothetical protein
MGMVKEIQTVLDNITHDMIAIGLCGQLLIDEVREAGEWAGVSDYFIDQYVQNLDVSNLKEEMYDG